MHFSYYFQPSDSKKSAFDDDIDGKPINSESVDNRPLALVADYDDEEDIDGKPISMQTSSMDDDIDGRPLNPVSESISNSTKKHTLICTLLTILLFYLARPRFQEKAEETSSSSAAAAKARFVPTKWESIDPTQVASQGKIYSTINMLIIKHTRILLLSCHYIKMGF